MVPTHPWVDLELLEPAILASKFLNAAYTRRAGKVFDQGRQQTLELGVEAQSTVEINSRSWLSSYIQRSSGRRLNI